MQQRQGSSEQFVLTLHSVPSQNTGTKIKLSLKVAIERGLRYNLGLVEANQASADVRAERLRTLSALLPQLSADARQGSTQSALVAEMVMEGHGGVTVGVHAAKEKEPEPAKLQAGVPSGFEDRPAVGGNLATTETLHIPTCDTAQPPQDVATVAVGSARQIRRPSSA